MKTTKLEVKGMNCVGCSTTVNNYLQSLNLEEIQVDFSSGEVSFINAPAEEESSIIKGIEKLGFQVIQSDDDTKKKGWTLSF